METDRIKYFCTIAETGSLTAAASILNVSHSGLSKAMSVLQSELNIQLFRPLGRGLELTASGKEVYLKSKNVLESIELLKENKTNSKKKTVKIGLSEIFSISIVGEIAQNLTLLNQPVDFYEIDSGEAEVKILDGDIDFAISFIPFPKTDLEYLKLKKIEMGVYYKNSKFKNYKLSELPFVVPNSDIKNNPLSVKSRDGWPAHYDRNVMYTASSLAMALKIVESENAAIFIPKFLARSYSHLYEYQIKKNLLVETDREIFLVKKKNIDETRAMKLVVKAIRGIV